MRLQHALLALKCKKARERALIPSRNRKKFMSQLDDEERYRRQRRIPRCALVCIKDSPWRRVYESRDDQAMITLTGFDMKSFRYVLQLFTAPFVEYSPFCDRKNGYVLRTTCRWLGFGSCLDSNSWIDDGASVDFRIDYVELHKIHSIW